MLGQSTQNVVENIQILTGLLQCVSSGEMRKCDEVFSDVHVMSDSEKKVENGIRTQGDRKCYLVQ